jgi:error-prone DNA polymerase
MPDRPPYAELSVTTNFTFLTGASHPEEMVERASALGHEAVAVTDTHTLAGIVRAHVAAKRVGLPLVVGARLCPSDGPALLVYPTTLEAYGRLCRLLTLGKRRAPKGECHLSLDDVCEHAPGLLGVVEDGAGLAPSGDPLRRLREAFDDDRLSLGVWRAFGADDGARVGRASGVAAESGVPLVAINRVLCHDPRRRELQDVVTCIRHGCTLEEAGTRLEANAERHLKPGAEMARLLPGLPGAMARSVEVARRASGFTLDALRYRYPRETCPPGLSPTEHLRRLALAGASSRYPGGVPEATRRALEHELALIAELAYEAYFLTCHDIVRFARSRGILCQGRGGAANSAVCYCLGITEVDPARHSLLFERFISRERGEPPDIDIDFEHERREEVIQYIYAKYGRDRAALTAEVIRYRGRSAVREVGKAMGLPADCVDLMARNLSHWHERPSDRRVREIGLNPADLTIRRVIELSGELAGFPRHLSQHVGGFVITETPLCELVPIENAAMEDRTVIEWDKDDIDAMGMLKVDCLGLGMLTCIRKAFALAGPVAPEGGPPAPLTIERVMATEGRDDDVYDMICRADTVGVFQIESRAQMSMLPRLRPREFYDLVIEVAIVRPGPIQGGMVHPYLRRRQGGETATYPTPEIEAVLGRTLGVPLFQEQAMRLAIVAAGFTPDEADGLRRAMAAWKRRGDAIHRYGRRLIEGMVRAGYPEDFAERCFEQIKGFSEYGFPESHAASFAILVYVSAWLKCRRPAAFAAALLNSQPMGFYQPAQIVRDAREHGVEVRPVDVNASVWDCTLEGGAVRLGMRMVRGLARAEADRLADAVRRAGPFGSVGALRRASGVGAGTLRALARADAFGSMGLDRQRALWTIRALRDEPLPLFDQTEHDAPEEETKTTLPEPAPALRVAHDYESVGLSLKAHPLSFMRRVLDRRGVIRAADLRSERLCPAKRSVRVAGLVLCRQRPGTASGVVFITLEDETGIANLILWRDTFERHRRAARLSRVLLARGVVERQGEVVHVHVRGLESLDGEAGRVRVRSRDFH